MLAAGVLGVSGCVSQAEHDAKVAEAKKQLATAESKTLQLQKDLDAAKIAGEKADTAKKDAEAKINTLEQESTGLKNQVATLDRDKTSLQGQVKTLKQANTRLNAKVSQLEKNIAAAKREVEKAEKAKKAAEGWEITLKKNVHDVRLVALENNRYQLVPKNMNLVFKGVYEFDGKTKNLSMVAENSGHQKFVWSLKEPGLFEIAGKSYAGATMKRKAIVGDEVKPSM